MIFGHIRQRLILLIILQKIFGKIFVKHFFVVILTKKSNVDACFVWVTRSEREEICQYWAKKPIRYLFYCAATLALLSRDAKLFEAHFVSCVSRV